MKKYQIDEKLINEIIDVLESYRNDLSCSNLPIIYISNKRWKARELRRKLRSLKRVKRFIFKVGFENENI